MYFLNLYYKEYYQVPDFRFRYIESEDTTKLGFRMGYDKRQRKDSWEQEHF